MPLYEVYASIVQPVMVSVEADSEEDAVTKAKVFPFEHDGKFSEQLQWGSSKDGWTSYGYPELDDLEVIGPYESPILSKETR